METEIQDLARGHAKAAIQVLAEIMNNPKAPAGVRASAAKTLLERAFGKTGRQPARGLTRVHSTCAVNAGLTWKASACSLRVAMREVVTMPAPQCSDTCAPGGS